MKKHKIMLYVKNIHRVIVLGVLHFLSLFFLSIGSGLAMLLDFMDYYLPVFGDKSKDED